MKTYAPKGLRGADLRSLLTDLVATPAQVAKFLDVTERSVWRWLADDSAPRAALYALWHETPHGRHVTALDVGNELVIVRGLAQGFEQQTTKQAAQLCRVLAISTTGAANDALVSGPWRIGPLGFDPVAQRRNLADDQGGQHGTAQHDQALPHDSRRSR